MAIEQKNNKAANKWNIPSDWEVKELGEIADVKGGKRIPKGENLTVENTGFPYIRVSDMFMGGVDSSKILFIPNHIEPLVRNYKIRHGELFITVAGTIGLIGEIPLELDNANLTENANKIVVKRADNKYVLFYLMSEKIQGIIKETTTNNAQPKLALERIRELKIPLPPLPEQKAIAKVLSTMDELIQKNQQLIAQKEQRKKWLMQQLLTGKKRLKGFSGEWKETSISEIGIIQTGNTPSKLEPENWGGTYNWCTADDMKSKYVVETIQKLSEKGWSTARIAKANSVLVTCIASIGVNAITMVDTGFNQQINSITPSENFNVEFVYYLIVYSKNKLMEYAGAGALPMLNKNTFMSIKLRIPCFEEQTAIAQVLQAADIEISLLKTKAEKLKEQKKGLMQLLLTGKKRLRVE